MAPDTDALQRSKIDAGVVVKFDLTSPDAPDDAPATFAGDIAQVGLGKRANDPQLRRMRDGILRLPCEHARDLLKHGR